MVWILYDHTVLTIRGQPFGDNPCIFFPNKGSNATFIENVHWGPLMMFLAIAKIYQPFIHMSPNSWCFTVCPLNV